MKYNEMKSIPRTRSEFERNFHILEESMRNRKSHFSKGASAAIQGLSKVNYLPNRRINLLSINENARLTANTIANFEYLNEEINQ